MTIDDLLPGYVLFGMTDEYLGRRVIPPTIESFYPAEGGVGEIFLRFLKQYQTPIMGIDTGEISKVITSEAGHFCFQNQYLSWEISRSFFGPATVVPCSKGDGKISQLFTMNAKDMYQWENKSEAALKSFLFGAILRYGIVQHDCITITLANSGGKMDNILRVLNELGVTPVKQITRISCPTMNIVEGYSYSLAEEMKGLRKSV